LFTFVYFCKQMSIGHHKQVIPCLERLLSKAVAPPSVLLLNMSNDPTRRRTRI
jgi:hypothetical protein